MELIYRLKKDQLKEILEFIKASKWSDLLNLDELTREMAAGRVLDGFTALVPTFAPTFKRTRGKRITLEKRENKVYEYNHWHQKNIEASSIQIQGTREGSRRLPSVSLVLSNKKVSGDVDQRLPSPSSSILSEDSISLAVQSDSTASHVFDKDTKSVDDDDDDEVSSYRMIFDMCTM